MSLAARSGKVLEVGDDCLSSGGSFSFSLFKDCMLYSSVFVEFLEEIRNSSSIFCRDFASMF